MISNADDEGYVRADAGSLRRLIFGFDDVVSKDDVQSYIDELQSMASIHFYDDSGEWYAHFTNWTKFQKLQKDRIQSSLYPMCSKCIADDKQVPTQVSIGKSRLEQNSVGKESAERKTNYPSQSSGSVADAQEKPRGVPEVAKLRDALHKKNPPKLGILLLLFSLLLLAKPTFAADKIVVRYTITSTNGHKSKPPAKNVAGGAGGGTGASTPSSLTRSASQQPPLSPRPFEMGGGGRGLAGSVKDQVLSAGAKRFGEHHTASLEALVMHESGFNQYAQNGSSGACGLFQAMPCEKMGCSLDNLQCQIDWGFGYIEQRYGTPTSAWDFWQSRRPINGRDVGNWY